ELQLPQQILFVGLGQRLEQFGIVVEVVLDGTFAASGDEQDLLDTVGNQFFHHILHDRFAGDRQHFLGLRLGGRQQAGPQTRNGNDCALNHLLNIATGASGPGDRQNCQRISGKRRRKFMAVLSVPMQCYSRQRKSEWRISRNNSPPFAGASRAWTASTRTQPRQRVHRCDPTRNSSRNSSPAKWSPRRWASTSKPKSSGSPSAATAASTSPILPNSPTTCSTRCPPEP